MREWAILAGKGRLLLSGSIVLASLKAPVQGLFGLVTVGFGVPAVWESTAQLQEILSRDHGRISLLSEVGSKDHDFLNVGPSNLGP